MQSLNLRRALLKCGDECLVKLVESHWNTDEVLSSVQPENFDAVVLSGGDGTVSSLLYGLRGCQTPILVFPSGTANLLAASIGKCSRAQRTGAGLQKPSDRSADLGEITWTTVSGETHVAGVPLMAGTGLDAEIMRSAIPHKQTFGEAAYFTAALANLMPPVHDFKITVDGKVHELQGIGCLIANSSMMQLELNWPLVIA